MSMRLRNARDEARAATRDTRFFQALAYQERRRPVEAMRLLEEAARCGALALAKWTTYRRMTAERRTGT